MLETYQGILRDNRIEWSGEAPPLPAREQGVRVHVTLLEPVTAPVPEQGRRMAEALERLAALAGVASVADPMAWEREMRQDRPLPGRDD
jgi:hypothetical protein